jgi:hypothetical protein
MGLRKPEALRAKFDRPVDALAGGVGDVGVDEWLDLRPPCLDGPGESVQFGDVGVGAPLSALMKFRRFEGFSVT